MCVSDQRTGNAMASVALALTRGDSAARLIGLHLERPLERTSVYLGDSTNEARHPLDGARSAIAATGRHMESISFTSTDPAADICSVAGAKRAGLIMVGLHRPLIGRTLGGIVGQVFDQSPVDVAVVIDRGHKQIARVLVPYAGTRNDRAALGLARRLAEGGTSIVLMHVVPPSRSADDPGLGAKPVMAEQVGDLGRVEVRVVPHARPVQAVLDEVDRGYDLVVVGRSEAWGMERRLSFKPEEVISRSSASMLVVSAPIASGA
jgi:hypothetical protein